MSKPIPSLFVLKGEARSLQARLSASECRHVTLSHAQQQLAVTYGRRDWQALRAAAIAQHPSPSSPSQSISRLPGADAGAAVLPWPLPAEVSDFLESRARSTQLHPDTVASASAGVVFVYDLKDAYHFHVDDVAVSDDDLFFVRAPKIAPTMWSGAMNGWIAAANEPPDPRPFALQVRPFSELDPVGLMTESILTDLAFFRYAGTDPLDTFEQAYGFALSRCFFHPLYIILRGQAFDCRSIPKITVDGVVVRCNLPG